MRKILMGLLFLFVAVFGMAQPEEQFGDWYCMTTEGNLLDAGTSILMYLEENTDGRITIFNSEIHFVFNEFLSSENERHEKRLIFITNKMEQPITLSNLWLGDNDRLCIFSSNPSFEVIRKHIKEATELAVRTFDYRNNAVTIYFNLNPEDTTKAIDWLMAQPVNEPTYDPR